jgi:8-oxo-dGTP pyrophosphatase MutT (NUDIX family)
VLPGAAFSWLWLAKRLPIRSSTWIAQGREMRIVQGCTSRDTIHDARPNFQNCWALFIGPDGKVLLGLRAPWKKVWPLYWDSIGGRDEGGESLDDALRREVQEEVGVTPTSVQANRNSQRAATGNLWRCAASYLCRYALAGW